MRRTRRTGSDLKRPGGVERPSRGARDEIEHPGQFRKRRQQLHAQAARARRRNELRQLKPREFEHPLVHQRVVEDDVRLLERAAVLGFLAQTEIGAGASAAA